MPRHRLLITAHRRSRSDPSGETALRYRKQRERGLTPRRRAGRPAQRQEQQAQERRRSGERAEDEGPGVTVVLVEVAAEIAVVGGEEGAVAERAHRAALAMAEERRREIEQRLPAIGEAATEIDVFEPGGKEALVEAAAPVEDAAPQGERRCRRLLDRTAGGRLGGGPGAGIPEQGVGEERKRRRQAAQL